MAIDSVAGCTPTVPHIFTMALATNLERPFAGLQTHPYHWKCRSKKIGIPPLATTIQTVTNTTIQCQSNKSNTPMFFKGSPFPLP